MDIKELAEKHKEYIIQQRRHFHAIPELSLNEINTTKTLTEELNKIGVDEVITFNDFNGVIGIIHGGKPGKTIMLRADIDALPVEEHTGLSFASTNGNMHACGHDGHIAVQLGAAKILMELREELHGDVKLLFQPGEEVAAGAKYFVNNGYLDDVDAVYGTHIWSQVESGKFSLEAGERMASCDIFKIIVDGESSHGSAPNLGKDALFAAASIIMNVQSFVSRRNNPLNAVVVSIGTITGGQRWNIIANHVEMEGTTRVFNKETRNTLEDELNNIIQYTAKALGVTARLEYTRLTNPLVNDNDDLNRIAYNAAVKLYGVQSITLMPKLLGAEDFGYLMDKVPGFYGFIGCKTEDMTYNNHSDKFTIDESVLHRGSALAAQFAYDFLKE